MSAAQREAPTPEATGSGRESGQPGQAVTGDYTRAADTPPIPDQPGRHRLACPKCDRGPRDTALSILVEPDGAACWLCWRCGWSGSNRGKVADTEVERRRRAEARRQREREECRQREQAAERARRLWHEARPADPRHPYLSAKRIQPHHARQQGDRLVLPLVDLDGRIHSLQFIGPDGSKRMLASGRKAGCAIPVSGRRGAGRVLICEGWATGATLAEIEPDALVLAAVDAGNLHPVAVDCRKRWPEAEIIVCGDADQVGREKARSAALAAGALVAIPEIAPEHGTDYNDLARVEVVR